MINRIYKKLLIIVLALTKCSKNVAVSAGPEQITEAGCEPERGSDLPKVTLVWRFLW